MSKYWFLLCLIFLLSACARPIADFSASKGGEVAPIAVQFDNSSKEAESYLWDFGDGTTSEDVSPSHNYYLSGKYNVTLVAKKGKKSNKKVQHIYVEAPKVCLISLETSKGDMVIQLSDLTPKHRDNFIKNAEEGFYEGLLFHRVIKGFMAQGGDPDSKGAAPGRRLGSGGPGYTIAAEITPALGHVKGALAAARQPDNVNPDKRSSGSQFYIVHGRDIDERMLNNIELQKGIEYTKEDKATYYAKGGYPLLDMEYTVFGHIVKGLEILDIIANETTDQYDRPKEDVIIKKLRVIK